MSIFDLTPRATPTRRARSEPNASPSEIPCPEEAARLTALRRYDILDTPPEEAFDRLTRLAARWIGVPIALVTLVDESRQWFKSCYGIDRRETPRDHAFCAHNLHHPRGGPEGSPESGPEGDPERAADRVLVVEDATRDRRFADNPLVTGEPGIRFYAGAPLVTPSGHTLGSLCVIDTEPRGLSERERESLVDLAALAVDELELRRSRAQQKRTAETLRHQQQRLRQLARNVPGILYQFVARPDGTRAFRYVSEAAPDLLGIDPDLDGFFERALRHVPSPHRERIFLSNEAAIAAGEPWSGEFPFVTPAGETVWLKGLSRPHHEGETLVYSGVFIDVTARKRREEQIHLQAEALGAAANAIAITAADGTITWVNPAFTELTGYAEREAVGQTLRLLDSGVHPPAFYEAMWDTVTSGRVWHGELVNRRKDGTLYIEEQTITPVPGAAGRVQHAVAIKQDVTERLRRERELISAKEDAEAARQDAEAARAQAEEMNRLKTAFLANMSHEIRTPLTSIIGFAEVIDDMELDPPADEFANLIHRSGERLLATLNSVLDLSQLEAGAMPLHLERLDASALLGEVTDSFQLRADEAGVALTTDLPDGDAMATLDRAAFERIAANLISNAIKFTDPGGEVHVSLRAAPETLTLTVADTGVGINEAFLPHLFEAFHQESSGAGRQFEGSGLGLAITHQLVDLLGGTIDVESQKGEGTTFTVALPRTPRQADAGPSEAGAPDPR